jgi:DNA-binding response OmpR family regulator
MINGENFSAVLVVDDEPIIQETFKAIFDGHFKVLTASNADETFERIDKNSVDLVFLDINIPGANGIEILRRLKEYDEDLPVIVVTGVESEILAKELKTLGVCDYISKPFDVPELVALAYKTIKGERIIK